MPEPYCSWPAASLKYRAIPAARTSSRTKRRGRRSKKPSWKCSPGNVLTSIPSGSGPRSRGTAAYALGLIGDVSALDAIRRLDGREGRSYWQVRLALGDRTVIDEMLARMARSDWRVYWNARDNATAFGKATGKGPGSEWSRFRKIIQRQVAELKEWWEKNREKAEVKAVPLSRFW